MNCLPALSALIGVALVAGGVWWALAPDRVLKRQLSRQARRARHVEPTEFSAFWDGR